MLESNLSEAPIDHLLVKLATRCNINCDYCYWFRDEAVYNYPKRMTTETCKSLVRALREHLIKYELEEFFIFYHGGEPLLFGKQAFRELCEMMKTELADLPTKMIYGVTTNGLLLDEEWLEIFDFYDVKISLSLDGPKHIHDKHRVDAKGQGTYERVIEKLALLKRHNQLHGVLAVCEPSTDPRELLDHFFELGIIHFDILVPDCTHDEHFASIANYYTKLFDTWYEDYSNKKVTITSLDSFIRVSLGMPSRAQMIGIGPINTVNMMTDGTLQAVDMLNICGENFLGKTVNINQDPIDAIKKDPIFKEAFIAALNLPKTCQQCEIVEACGGGPLQSRWSNERRFDNPSVYCDDLKAIIHHVKTRVSSDLYIEK